MCSEAKNTSCPYFAQSRHECQMTYEGLYIPTLTQIHSRCMTGDYGQCHHYLQGRSALSDFAAQFGVASEASRRRYRRISAQIPLRLIAYGHDQCSGLLDDVLDEEAFALDLSLGGLRLATTVPLPVRKTVAFVFGREAEKPVTIDGHGEIRWTRELDSGGFQSGLLVTDKRTFEAIGQRMTSSSLAVPQ